MSNQQEKEFGFEEDVFGDDGVFSVEELDIVEDPVPEFEALAPAVGAAGSGPGSPGRPQPAVEPDNLIGGEPVMDAEPPTEHPRSQSSRSRLLLLVLLLVAVGAGGLFFLLGGEEPAPVAKHPVPQNKPIPVPKPVTVTKPASEPPVVTERLRPDTEAVPPAAPAEQAPAAAAAPTAAAPTAAASTAAASTAAASTAAASTEVDVPSIPADQLSPPLAAVPTEKAQVPSADQQAAAGRYRVQVGAYVLPGSLQEAEAKLHKLGYEPQVDTGSRNIAMTRLLFGRFPAVSAARELERLKQVAPDAFMVHVGNQVDIYAGSYVSLDKARRFADLLYEKQVRVEERSAEVPVPLYLLSVGPLPDRQAAEAVLKRLQQEGLKGLILARSPEAG